MRRTARRTTALLTRTRTFRGWLTHLPMITTFSTSKLLLPLLLSSSSELIVAAVGAVAEGQRAGGSRRPRRCCVPDDAGLPGAALAEEDRGAERKASQQQHLLLDAAREAANEAVATAKPLYLRDTISSVAAHGVVSSQSVWFASRTERMTHDVGGTTERNGSKTTPLLTWYTGIYKERPVTRRQSRWDEHTQYLRHTHMHDDAARTREGRSVQSYMLVHLYVSHHGLENMVSSSAVRFAPLSALHVSSFQASVYMYARPIDRLLQISKC